jgi:hypothetical protein
VTDSGEPAATNNRSAAIYAAIIRQLVRKDHTFGGADPGFKIVYVLDGVVVDAADPSKPTNSHDPSTPFPHDVKDGVRFLSTVADLPPVEFVAERESVVTGTHGGRSPGRIRHNGVLISSGRLSQVEGESTSRRVCGSTGSPRHG